MSNLLETYQQAFSSLFKKGTKDNEYNYAKIVALYYIFLYFYRKNCLNVLRVNNPTYYTELMSTYKRENINRLAFYYDIYNYNEENKDYFYTNALYGELNDKADPFILIDPISNWINELKKMN